MKNFILLLLLLLPSFVSAEYFIVRDADNVVIGVYKSDPGAAPALHTKYNETTAIDISGWNADNEITRTGVNTYVSANTPFQATSFAIDQSSNQKFWVTRDAMSFDFMNPFTLIFPVKGLWSTGLGNGWLMDLLSSFYMYLSPGFLNIRAFDGVGNSTTSTAITLVDNAELWLGITYDGAGGYQFIVNDQLKTNSNTRVLPTSTSILKMGERSGFNVALDMEMGNVLVLNKVISASELTDYYNGGVSRNAFEVFANSEVVHYYCADNLQGDVIVDDGGVPSSRLGARTQNSMATQASSF